MKRFKPVLQNLAVLGMGSVLALLLAEFVLRIWQPFPTRIKGEEIRLITNYSREVHITQDYWQPGLDDTIRYSTNSLGLRGPEPPLSSEATYKIIAVGGSTTECSVLDDEKAWPSQLCQRLRQQYPQVWLNNAGIDGTSLYAHQILLENHLLALKPDMILTLVGVNDFAKVYHGDDDGDVFSKTPSRQKIRGLMQKSELFSTLLNVYRMHQATQLGLHHNPNQPFNPKYALDSTENVQLHLAAQDRYSQKLKRYIDTCLAHRIEPVFITQPVFQMEQSPGFQFLRLYNETLHQVAAAHGLLCIDLATALPDDPLYYYDELHYTNPGAAAVAQIIDTALAPLLQQEINSPQQVLLTP